MLRALFSPRPPFSLRPFSSSLARFKSSSSSTASHEERPLFDKILIANRGEIACRVMRTARRLGIRTVAIYSDADANALHVRMADEAVLVGPAPTSKSYLNIPAILNAIQKTGAQAVHPGYGFLSENSKFVQALDKAGVAFIGPSEHSMAAMGDKIESKILAKKSGVHTIPGFNGVVENVDHALKIAREIGYPVMLKASAGGGGKGMRIAWNDQEVKQNFKVAKNESMSSFGDDRLLVEKFIDNPRHIEIQLIGDKHGNTYYLPERECSIQRRNQKVIEEAPSSFIDQKTRDAMGKQAVQLAQAVGYYSAGTVEFLVDSQRNFYFLEMNTRLQVEHPITEYITGLDLVEQMIRVAANQKLTFDQNVLSKPNGWAFESRVYAEDPQRYLPSIGRLTTYIEPKASIIEHPEVRCDSGIVEGSEITVYYDPMICKLCTYGPDRPTALNRMANALDNYVIQGVTHNIPLLREVIEHPRFVEGRISTKFLAEEYPTGFTGHALTDAERQKLISVAAYIHVQRALRDRTWVDQDEWDAEPLPETFNIHVAIRDKDGQETISQKVTAHDDGETVSVQLDGTSLAVDADWTLESPLVKAKIGEEPVTVQYLDMLPLGFRLSYKGTKYDVAIKTQRQHDLSKFMKKKPKIDWNKFILSPMPGTVVSLSVKPGDTIAEGAEVATVEAMKMQNVLRSARSGRVKAIKVKEGASVQADEILIELEDGGNAKK